MRRASKNALNFKENMSTESTKTEEAEETTETTEATEPTKSSHITDRKFTDFPLRAETLRGIADLGFEYATPVQEATIEPGLAGKDMLVRAKTGTGKTAAFSIPAIENIPDGTMHPAVIILAPTRELAKQTAEFCEAITAYRDINVALLVGGVPMPPQERQLEVGVAVVIGTPGRILDHIRRGNLDLAKTKVIVLDEADEMLSMGFYKDVTALIDATADDRQVLLFSATINADTENLVKRYLKDPENIVLSTDTDRVEGIDHIIYNSSPTLNKLQSLLYIIDIENPTSAIIFCNTRQDTSTVSAYLSKQGHDCRLLSGELAQNKRDAVMKAVKAGEVRFLAATDVAARGIDISNLSHVFNYSLPNDPDVYLHRTGRTGRIGNQGTAISLMNATAMATRKVLTNKHEIPFIERELPSKEEATARRVNNQAALLKAALGTTVFESFLPTVKALLERPDGHALIAVALRAFFRKDRMARARPTLPAPAGGRSDRRDDRHDDRRDDRGGRGGRDNKRGRGRDDDRGRGRGRDRDDRGRGNKSGGKPQSRQPDRAKKSSNDELDALLSFD